MASINSALQRARATMTAADTGAAAAPLDAADRPAEVASLAGMMLGVGYTLSALSPLLLGALRDATGGFTAVVWALVVAAAVLVAVDASVSPARLAAARSSAGRPPRAAST